MRKKCQFLVGALGYLLVGMRRGVGAEDEKGLGLGEGAARVKKEKVRHQLKS